MHACIHTCIKTDRQTGMQTDRRTDGQTDRQTPIHPSNIPSLPTYLPPYPLLLTHPRPFHQYCFLRTNTFAVTNTFYRTGMFVISDAAGRLKCLSNVSGVNYAGSVGITRSGRLCQRWDAQTPHTHNVTTAMLPDVSVTEAEAFCRSPDQDRNGPWCFTTDPQVVWEYCDIPTCGESL